MIRAVGEGIVAVAVVGVWTWAAVKFWHLLPDERVALGMFFGIPVAVILAALGLEALRRRLR